MAADMATISERQRTMLVQLTSNGGSVPWSWWSHLETDARRLHELGLVKWVPGTISEIARWDITGAGREAIL